MKISNFFFLVFLSFTVYFHAQTPTFQWARSIGGPGSEWPRSVLTDPAGNIYTAGYFSGACDFNPGPGTAILNAGNSNDIFVSKLDPNGNYLWAISIGAGQSDMCRAMSMDALGNLLLTGVFRGTVDFDPGAGSYTLATLSSSVSSMFILKLDANGNFIWARQVGDGLQNMPDASSVTTDASNNVYALGDFMGTREFDPGPGTVTLSAGSGTANPTGLNIFVLKLDANGIFVWVRQLGAQVSTDIDTDAQGNVILSGQFEMTADFDPGPTTYTIASYAGSDGFIAKLAGNGNFIWARQLGGDDIETVYTLDIDCEGNVLSAGTFGDTFYGNPTIAVPTFTSFGNPDIFVSKLDANGNFIWCRQIGGDTFEGVAGICTGTFGEVYLAGSFGYGIGSPCDFDPGPGTYNLNAVGGGDPFYCRLSSTGNLVWAYEVDGPTGVGDAATDITLDKNNLVYVIGQYNFTCDFDPFSTTFTMSAVAPPMDAFVLGLLQPGMGVAGTTSLCGSGNATLTTSGPVNWYATNTPISALATGTVFTTPSLSTTTTYYIGNAVCMQTVGMVPVTITVNPLPIISVTPNPAVACSGNSLTLSGGGANTYLWNNGFNTPAITVIVLANTSYTLTGTSINSCSNTAVVNVSVAACTGLAEPMQKHISFGVYPNPAINEFFIQADESQPLLLINAMGQTVKQINAKQGKTPHDISELKPGIYLISSENDAKIRPQKLVILK